MLLPHQFSLGRDQSGGWIVKQPIALIVDDEPDIRRLLKMSLARIDVAGVCVDSMQAAHQALQRQAFALCLTDMRLPDGDGLDLVRHCQAHYPTMPVAVLTAHGSMESAIQALKSGAFDFLSKPVDISLLRTVVGNALKLGQPVAAAEQCLIGNSEVMRTLCTTINKLARSQAPVSICGESGTGKELVARMIHSRGPRAEQPFIPVNCAAIPSELLESEFFGHIRGSFTGAVRDAPGLFRAANGGTLFLDEIAELPQHMQVKLLRAIQEKAVRPVGAKEEVSIDVRLLSATNQDLHRLVQEGRFREDLYYRIHVIALDVPPLRSRQGDIPLLVEHILAAMPEAAGRRLAPGLIEHLQAYRWPGNVRELENTLERAVALSDQRNIEIEALQLPTLSSADEDEPEGLVQLLATVERDRILEALQKTRGDRARAATLLGLSQRSLRYRIRKLGMDPAS